MFSEGIGRGLRCRSRCSRKFQVEIEEAAKEYVIHHFSGAGLLIYSCHMSVDGAEKREVGSDLERSLL